MTEIVAITLSVAAVLFEKWRVTSPMAVANAMGEFREERGGAVLVAAPAPDETTAPVLDPGRGRTKTGQLWAYAADDGRGAARIHRALPVSTRPMAKPSGRSPISMASSASGYRKLAERGDVRLAFCWSHVRRNFYELAVPGSAPIASEALEHIATLYAVDKDIRGHGADERRAVRQQKSRPRIDSLEPWLRPKLGRISQKSKLAEAIRYALSRWEGLTRFIDDGLIELDNNTVGRSIRPIALNPKVRTTAPSIGPSSLH